MSDSFHRTVRALHTDGMNPTVLGLMLGTGLIAVWCWWLVQGQVSVYETSTTARVEVDRVYPVAAAVGGRIVASSLELGRQVRSGDVLLEVEAESERLETTEERARLAALTSQLAAIDTEITAEEQAIALTRRAAGAALAELKHQLTAIEATARQTEDQQGRVRQLAARGLMAEADLVRVTAEADGRRADVAAGHFALQRVEVQQIAEERERQGHLGALMRERLTLEGQRAALVAAVARREREAEERRISAPVDGRLGEVAQVQIGAVVREGERLASIVPNGPLKAVAEFLPPALGRVRGGQMARLRLEGFPWTQYGYIPATVQNVASETRDGRVRVELTLQHSAITIEHGLPGTVEIEVERVAPVTLLIRTLGRPMTTVDARPAADEALERDGQ